MSYNDAAGYDDGDGEVELTEQCEGCGRMEASLDLYTVSNGPNGEATIALCDDCGPPLGAIT